MERQSVSRRVKRSCSAFIAIAIAGAQNGADSARLLWRRVADQRRPRVAKLAALMDDAEPDVLTSMSVPARHRAKLHSTVPLERAQRREQVAHRGGRHLSPRGGNHPACRSDPLVGLPAMAA